MLTNRRIDRVSASAILDARFTVSTTIEIPDEILARLAQLAESTGRATSQLARQALLEYLDDQEDSLIVAQRLKKGGPRIPFEDLERELGLER